MIDARSVEFEARSATFEIVHSQFVDVCGSSSSTKYRFVLSTLLLRLLNGGTHFYDSK